MKKVVIFLIAVLIVGGLSFYAGLNLSNGGSKKEQEGEVNLHNHRILDEYIKVNDDGYKVLDIIDNEDDYEEFIDSYDYNFYQEQKSFKDYNKKYKYIMVAVEYGCVKDLEPTKYKLNGDTLTIYADYKEECGLCASYRHLYEFTVDKDLKFKKVKVKLHDTNGACRTDVDY